MCTFYEHLGESGVIIELYEYNDVRDVGKQLLIVIRYKSPDQAPTL